MLLFFPKLDPRESGTVKAWEPISVITLAGHLINQGFSVEICDSRTQDDIKDILARNKDDLLYVGVTAMAGYQVVDGYLFSKHVKEHFPQIPVIWGGWYPTIAPDQCLESPFIDVAVRGQGEAILPEITAKMKTLTSISDTTGISYKQDGKVVHNPLRPLVDLNIFLPVNYELLDTSRYTLSEGFLHYITSVGCPYSCTFCGVSSYLKRKWYSLNPERIVHEIKVLCQKYPINRVAFFDSTLFVNLKKSKEMLKGFVRENLNFSWGANSYVDQVVNFDDEMLELLCATKCVCLELGIESGSKRIREIFQKNFTDENIARAVEKLARIGIPIRGNYIIAPPLEKKEDFLATIRSMSFVKKAHPDNNVITYQYIPVPGTPLAEYERKKFLPKGIVDWITWYCQVAYDVLTPWAARKDEFGRQPILLYFKLAFIQPLKHRRIMVFPLMILQKLAAFRLKHEIFSFQVEWYLFRCFLFFRKKGIV